jgi:hypothetical protein
MKSGVSEALNSRFFTSQEAQEGAGVSKRKAMRSQVGRGVRRTLPEFLSPFQIPKNFYGRVLFPSQIGLGSLPPEPTHFYKVQGEKWRQNLYQNGMKWVSKY